jgi:hypothetical protein
MKQITTIIIAVLAAIAGASISYKLVREYVRSDVRSPLDSIASSLNAKVPMQVDKYTRWDSTAALPGNLLVYHYTISGIDLAKIDKTALRSNLAPILTATYKTSPDMKGLRDLRVNLKYVYRATDGVHLFDIEVPFTSIAPL